MVHGDGGGKRRVLGQLHGHFFGKLRHDLFGIAVHRCAFDVEGIELRFHGGQVFHREADVVHGGTVATLRGRGPRFADDDVDAGQAQQLESSGAGRLGPEHFHPGLLLAVGVLHHQVDVAERDSTLVGRLKLRKQRASKYHENGEPVHAR